MLPALNEESANGRLSAALRSPSQTKRYWLGSDCECIHVCRHFAVRGMRPSEIWAKAALRCELGAEMRRARCIASLRANAMARSVADIVVSGL